MLICVLFVTVLKIYQVFEHKLPDEEIGGKLGMGSFVKTDEFKKMNVGVSLDEGAPWPGPVSPIFYAERATWRK